MFIQTRTLRNWPKFLQEMENRLRSQTVTEGEGVPIPAAARQGVRVRILSFHAEFTEERYIYVISTFYGPVLLCRYPLKFRSLPYTASYTSAKDTAWMRQVPRQDHQTAKTDNQP